MKIVVILTALFTVNSWASHPLFPQLEMKTEKGQMDCPDFTGNWKGTCTYTTDTTTGKFAHSVNILMSSCSSILANDQYIPINGRIVNSMTESSRDLTSLTYISWNNNSAKEFLELESNHTVKHSNIKGLEKNSSIGTMKLVNGSLVSEVNSNQNGKKMSMICQLNR